MFSNLNSNNGLRGRRDTLRGRRDTLELTGGQQAATTDQLRERYPELFDKETSLEELQMVLSELCDFGNSNLKANLGVENKKKLDVFTADLSNRIQSTISKASFEFDVQHCSEDLDEDGFEKEHEITVAISNVEAILNQVKEPLMDVDKLRRLSALIAHLNSEIQRSRSSLPNFEEHNRIHEIEINVLKAELGDLEDQEKQGKLNRSEIIQKEQLEKEINKHHQAKAKNSKKINKKKKQMLACQKQIDQIVAQLSEFLSHFNPNAPENLPENLNVSEKGNNGSQIRTVSSSSKLRDVLSAKRMGRYSSFNPSLKRAKWIEEKKRFFGIWGPRVAAVLALSGAGLYATHEKIKTALAGISSFPVAEWIMDEEERLELLKEELRNELANEPSELALAKERVLDGWMNFMSIGLKPKDEIRFLSADTFHEMSWEALRAIDFARIKIDSEFFKISISRNELQSLGLIYNDNFRLIVKFAGESRAIHKLNEIHDYSGSDSFEEKFNLKLFLNSDRGLPLFEVHRILDETGNYEIHHVPMGSEEEFKNILEEVIALLEDQTRVAKRQNLEKADLLEAKADLLGHPLFEARGTKSIENWDQLEKGILIVENADNFEVILKELIPKLEKDPKVIAEVEKIVRSAPHLAFTEKGYDVSPDGMKTLKEGSRVTEDQVVSGMVTLGMDGRFLTKIRSEFGPAAQAEITLMGQDGKLMGTVFQRPYGPGATVMNFALNNVRRQCQVGTKVQIDVRVPFKNGKYGMGSGYKYANFTFQIPLLEIHGTKHLVGHEDALFCDELNAVRVPGFNGSPVKLFKYLDVTSPLYTAVAYAKSAKDVENNLPEVMEIIKNNPQFKKDLDEAMASDIRKLQFERYIYDESGNFEHKVFDGMDPLYLNSVKPKEAGRYIAYGVHPALISHLEELFGENIVDVQLNIQDKIMKEDVFCGRENGASIKVIIRLTPNHSFSLSYPVNLTEEGASVISECLSNEDEKEASVSKEVKETRELIDSIPLIGFLKFADVFKVHADANVRSLRDRFETQLKRNKKIFGKGLGDQIMNSYATTGINNEFNAGLKEKFGNEAKIRFLIIGSDGMKTFKLFGAEHINIMNVFRINHACTTSIDSFVEITVPSSSGQKSTFRIPVSSSDLKVQNGYPFCNSVQSLVKPDLHAMAEKLRSRNDELSRAKVRALDHMGDRLVDWQKFEVMVERGSVKSLRRFIQDMLPGCKKTVQMKNGRKVVHLEPHPENVEAMKAIYGKDVIVGVQFFVKGKPDGGYTPEDYQTKLDVDFDRFCDFDNIVTLYIKRPKQFSVDTIWNPGFYNEVCPDQTYEVRNGIDMYKKAHHKHFHK